MLGVAGVVLYSAIVGQKTATLELPGVPLGLLEGVRYDELQFCLEPGQTLILASDGAMEALNIKGEFYDIDRFTESISRHADKDVGELLRSLYTDVRQFIGSAELSDDITMIALRRKR